LEVTSEDIHDDGKMMLNKLVDSASENNNLKGILADGMYYDSNKNFRYLSKSHIKPGIKTRSNSNSKITLFTFDKFILLSVRIGLLLLV
jgi:hypothetical protein